MADENYPIPENPSYNPNVRALKNSDPAQASSTFNPLFQQLIENTAAVKMQADATMNTAGTAQETADAAQQALETHAANQENPHGVTAAQVGLGNADNTSDADKPVSAATQAALDGKAASSHTHTAAQVGLGKTLTFTGAVSGTYNGTAAKTVTIPSGKRTCKFVVGTATAGWTANDCDYLCDGTDDQVEINAAIKALPSTGGEVVILAGTYSISARIDVNKDNVTLSGNGQATVLKRMWGSTAYEGVIHVTSSYNTIQNLRVDGNKAAYAASNNYGIYLVSAKNATIVGNAVNNAGGVGIRLVSAKNATITGNTCGNNHDAGIEAHTSDDTAITGNTVNDCGNAGISLSYTSATVTGNTVNNSNVYGIYLPVAKNATIADNTINNAGGTGIRLSGSSNTVTGNACNNAGSGIVIYDARNNTIVGNTCIRGTGLTTDYTSTQYTIRLAGTDNKNNLIAYNNLMGKNYTSEGGTGNTFTGNKYN